MLSNSCKRIFPNLYQPYYLSQLYQSTQAQPQLTRELRYDPSPNPFILDQSTNSRKRDVIIIGAGHNGLTAASYLAKAGLDVLVLERRDKIGGAAITEEIFDGFKFSRASYLAGLLRPKILNDGTLFLFKKSFASALARDVCS